MTATTGSVISDVMTWVRRIVKPQSSAGLPDATILDYLNRFYMYDVPARLQLFELKRQYTFETLPNTYMYQIPFAPTIQMEVDSDNNPITSSFPGLQILRPPAYCEGVQIGYFSTNLEYFSAFPEQVNNTTPINGTQISGPYNHTLAGVPFLPSFIDYLGQINPYVIISAESTAGDMLFLVDDGEGTLNQMDSTFTTTIVAGVGEVDYVTGEFTDFEFNDVIPSGNPIRFQVVPYQAGRPTMTLVYDNYIKLFPVPDRVYKIQFETQLTPAQFLNSTDSVPFSYMSEYLARGTARKILSDTGDMEQFSFYEPLFLEQESNVLRRTNRQQLTTRTPTIFSTGFYGSGAGYGWYKS